MGKRGTLLKELDDSLIQVQTLIKKGADEKKMDLYKKQFRALNEINEYVSTYEWAGHEKNREKLRMIRESGFDYDFIETTASLTNEMEQMLKENGISVNRGKHWTTDAGYRETWEQVLDYRSKGALCVEMEGVGLFTIAKYRKCSATAIYIITDTISEDGWHLGWESNEIDKSIEKLIEVINC